MHRRRACFFRPPAQSVSGTSPAPVRLRCLLRCGGFKVHTTNAWSHDRRFSRRPQREIHLVTMTSSGVQVSPIEMRYEGQRYVACAEPTHGPLRGNADGVVGRGGRTLVAQARTAAACVEPSDVLRPRSQGRYAEAIRMKRKVPTAGLPPASDGSRTRATAHTARLKFIRPGLVDVLRHRDRDRRRVCGAGQLPP
jgi:hypothetical protein